MPSHHHRRFAADLTGGRRSPEAQALGVPVLPVDTKNDAQPAARNDPGQADPGSGCTASQLRRFIKSRPYVPMHELRRRFELNGEADDLSLIETADARYYVGLPARESQLIAELVGQGEIGVELCRDPSVPVVVGLFAMRPITRN